MPPPARPSRDMRPVSALPHKYTVLRVLTPSSGVFNAGILVVRRRDAPNSRPLIEKRFKPESLQSGLVRHEVKLLQELRGCEYITRWYDEFGDELCRFGSVFIEYCELGSLEDLIKRHRRAGRMICERWLWKCFLQLAKGVRYMHHGPEDGSGNGDGRRWRPILHRDLKPSNILLTDETRGPPARLFDRAPTPNVRIADFGCAVGGSLGRHHRGAQELEMFLHGDPAFFPPEAPEWYAEASDVWGVGMCVLLACVLGVKLKPVIEMPELYSRALDACVHGSVAPDWMQRTESLELPGEVRRAFLRVEPELDMGDLIVE